MPLLVDISDFHVGSKLGLCPPTVTMDKGGTYRFNKLQAWLWPHYTGLWKLVKEMRQGQDLYLICNGEFRDGVHFTAESFTTNEADITQAVIQVLEPIKECQPDYTFCLRGSQAHSGLASWYDEFIAKYIAEDFNVQANPNTGDMASDALNLWIDDFLFDVTHHVAMGRLPHTEAASIPRAINTVIGRYGRKERLPDFILRAHNHRMFDSGNLVRVDQGDGTQHTVRMLTTPGWKYPDSHLHKYSQSVVPHFGAWILQIDGSEVEAIPYRRQPRRGKAWKKS